jgi:hypothetical protein
LNAFPATIRPIVNELDISSRNAAGKQDPQGQEFLGWIARHDAVDGFH